MTTPPTPDQTPTGWNEASAGYNRDIAPNLAPYADHAIALAGVQSSDEVLDVAAGGGLLSLKVAKLARRVLATDFASDMVSILETRVGQSGLSNVETSVGAWVEITMLRGSACAPIAVSKASYSSERGPLTWPSSSWITKTGDRP